MMTNQTLSTTIISILILAIAILLAEQYPTLKAYLQTILSFFQDIIWNNLLLQNTTTSSPSSNIATSTSSFVFSYITTCRLSQFGALIILRKLYTEFIRPMYLILSTIHNEDITTNLKSKYGSWCVIVGDFHLGNVPLMREFGRDLVSKGINVLVLDCSLAAVEGENNSQDSAKSNNNNNRDFVEREYKMRKEVVNLFMDDLRQCALKYENDHMEYSLRSNGNGHHNHDNGSSLNNGSSKNYTAPQVEILVLKDGTFSNFCSKVTSKLGNIAQDGGIGFLIHCFSSKQVTIQEPSTTTTTTTSSSSSTNYTPSYKKYGTDKFISVLNLTLPYMIFRGTGAIINVSSEDHDDDFVRLSYSPSSSNLSSSMMFMNNTNNNSNDVSCKARGVAECAFYTQLIRSIHYEYGEYGLDSLAISMSSRDKTVYPPDVVVRSSLCMLGEEYSELDLKICRYVSLFKCFFKMTQYD